MSEVCSKFIGGLNRRKMFILAAGFGKRLLPLTSKTPKPLIPMPYGPLLGLLLDYYKKAGVTRFGINAHHLHEQIMEFLIEERKGLDYTLYLEEGSILGTGGGLRSARSFFGGESILVANADALLKTDTASLFDVHESSGAVATMLIKGAKDPDKFGRITIDKSGRVVGILDAKSPIEPEGKTRYYMFTGIHIISPMLLDKLPSSERAPCIIRDAYIPALESGCLIRAIKHKGYFSDTGTPAEYIRSYLALLSGELSFGFEPSEKFRTISDNVYISPRAKIAPDVLIKGPVAVAAGAVIKSKASLGPNTVVEKNALVNSGAILSDCFIAPDAIVGEGETVSEKIVI